MTQLETDSGRIVVSGNVSPTRSHEHSDSRSLATSKWSRRSETPPTRGSSPSIMSIDHIDKRSSSDITRDETISILDPRRFTPTLHANLVSEILALRRDQEEKTRQIDSLENALHSAKEDHERLQEILSNTSKESRSLRRQLSLLEGGTSSALGELARERDEAVDCSNETKRKLEIAQKKIREQDHDSKRAHGLWALERDGWDDERRKFERKLHVAESHLKVVLNEVAVYQAKRTSSNQYDWAHGDEVEDAKSGQESDDGSVRAMSLTDSIDAELILGNILPAGNSLAEELTCDDHTDSDVRESILSQPKSPKHNRTCSRESSVSPRHHREYSIEGFGSLGDAARGSITSDAAAVPQELECEDAKVNEVKAMKTKYVDSGVQFSPPSSPQTAHSSRGFSATVSHRMSTPEMESPVRADAEIEANQRRKRVHISRPLFIEPSKPDHRMVSASSQTAELPLSPPKTPQSLPSPDVERNVERTETISVRMVTTWTQTEEAKLDSPVLQSEASSGAFQSGTRVGPLPLEIPIISVQPPTSRPSTPQAGRLPQHFKDFGCQVNIASSVHMSDACVQTEGIQVDKRLAILPPHLQPSAISSRPTSPYSSEMVQERHESPIPDHIPPRNPKRLASGPDSVELSSSPLAPRNDGDNLPLSDKMGARRVNRRVSSIFGGYDTASSDDGIEFGDGDISDVEYRTALSAPRPQSRPVRVTIRGSFGTASPEQAKERAAVRSAGKSQRNEMCNALSFDDKENQVREHGKRPNRTYRKAPVHSSSLTALSRPSAIRKAAIIQSGIASEQSRPRSPSSPDGQNPPFPIPNRESSRRSQVGLGSASDGWQSPVEVGTWHRRGSSRSSQHSHGVRKVRSAAALPRATRYRKYGSRSPPPLSTSTEAPESPRLPPLPRNDITTPRPVRDRAPSTYRRHQHELSANTDNTLNTSNTVPTTDTTASHSTGVVDAIAQTMVGEWMLKYVRRGKSFSIPESHGKDDSSNDRHKRWVWLAPYERSILWSSKQPVSGSALLGKTGRKLTIQSVLDVKDDNPAPKMMSSVFNRSILILTPQRALKFTATSAERHYLWLTALSFLAHSSQTIPEIMSAPHPSIKSQPPPKFEPTQPRLKRGRIRDSIRIAKGKAYRSKSGFPSTRTASQVPPSRTGDVRGPRMVGSSPSLSAGHGREAAEAPSIPRFSDRIGYSVATHGRKRSYTGGHIAPPLSFRGFYSPGGSGNGSRISGMSIANESDDTIMSGFYHTFSPRNATGNTSLPQSQCTSEDSSRPSNFFDAIGTVRMEAFISPLTYWQFDEDHEGQGDEVRKNARRRSKEIRRLHSRSRHRDGLGYKTGRIGGDHPLRGKYHADEDFFVHDDAFKGF